MKRWIILDRDGTINVDTGYLHEPDKVQLETGVCEGLKQLMEAGFRFIVVSNQSGIERGYFTQEELTATNKRITTLLWRKGITISGWYCCPHLPETNCECRKPKMGLVLQASKELGFELGEIACVIGDKKSDMQLGENLRVPSILVATGEGQKQYDSGVRGTYFVQDISRAADLLTEVQL